MNSLTLLFTVTGFALASPALAERIESTSRVSHVILYPQGASVTRSVEISAPAGQHEVILPDLPAGTDPNALRIKTSGATLGSVALQSGRALPDNAEKPAAIVAAEDTLRKAEDALRFFDRDLEVMHMKAEVLRQRAQITRDLLKGDSRLPVDEIPETVAEMGVLIQSLLEQATEWEFRARMTAPDRQALEEAKARAQAALNAVQNADRDHETLVLMIETTGQPAQIEITGFTENAGWTPSYDLRLDREADTLTMDRGMSVWQSSGEDWRDISLTLSTARPQGRTTPSEVQPWMPRISDTEVMNQRMQAEEMMMDVAAEPAPAMTKQPQISYMGITAVYDYPGAATLRDGVDALRLSLGKTTLQADILAEASPRFDDSAYLIAETVNSTGAPILPGNVSLYADGALVGRSNAELIADGGKMRFGFGPIDGLRAEIRLPEESEGDQGLIRRRNNRQETAILTVENLTAEEWPLRIVDRIPVSRQENLKAEWSADPAPTETNPDGKRGVLYWQAPIKPGETREITLETSLSWPEDYQLIR